MSSVISVKISDLHEIACKLKILLLGLQSIKYDQLQVVINISVHEELKINVFDHWFAYTVYRPQLLIICIRPIGQG